MYTKKSINSIYHGGPRRVDPSQQWAKGTKEMHCLLIKFMFLSFVFLNLSGTDFKLFFKDNGVLKKVVWCSRTSTAVCVYFKPSIHMVVSFLFWGITLYSTLYNIIMIITFMIRFCMSSHMHSLFKQSIDPSIGVSRPSDFLSIVLSYMKTYFVFFERSSKEKAIHKFLSV